MALVGTFAAMLAIGFSANTISLLALVLAIGIVVDDAIVVVEAVEHMMAEHPEMSPADATKAAMSQITGPIIAITLVLLSVFVPVAFIPGIVGQLYQQFAVAVSVSMLISALNALTLSPALCALLLRHGRAARRVIRAMQGGIDGMQRGYARRRRADRAADAADPGAGRRCRGADCRVRPRRSLGLSAGGGSRARLLMEAQLPEGASLNRTAEVASEVERITKATPGVAAVTSIVGYSLIDGINQSNKATFFVTLAPFDDRHIAGRERVGRTRPFARRVPESAGRDRDAVQPAADHRPRHRRRV